MRHNRDTHTTVPSPVRSLGLSLAALLLAAAPAQAEEPAEEAWPTEGAGAEPTAPEVVAAAPAEAPAAGATASYDKGFVVTHRTDKGSFQLKVNARVQSRLSVASEDDGTDRVTTGGFEIRRARLTLGGHAFSERLEYKLQADFGRGFVSLKDFIIDAEVADGLWLRTGQWKRPWSRQQITSSGNLQLVDRAITDRAFQAGRDQGLAIHNGYEKSPDLEWVAGVFNGTGETPRLVPVVDPVTGDVISGTFTNVPEDFQPVVIARVGLNRGGIKGYSEADLEGGGLRWAAAAGVWLDLGLDGDETPTHQAQVDAVVKTGGLAVSAAGYLAITDGEAEQFGGHLEVSKVLAQGAGKLLPAARYAVLVPTADGESAAHEVTVGAAWLRWGHNVKVSADLGLRFDGEVDPGDDLLARLEAQLAF